MTESRKPAKNRGETRDDALEDARDNNRDDTREESREEIRDDSRKSSEQSGPGDSGDSEAPATGPAAGEAADDRGGRPPRSGPLVWLALLIALASLGLASYPSWPDWLNPRTLEQTGPSTSEFERLAGRVDTIRQDSVAELDDLRDELNRLSSDFESDTSGPDQGVLAERIDQLSAEFSALAEAPGPDPSVLAGRIEQLSAQVKALTDAPGPDPGVLAERIDQLSDEIKALADAPGPDPSVLVQQIDELADRVERLQREQSTTLLGVRSRLEEIEAEVGRRLEQFEVELSNVGRNLDQADRDRVTRLLLTEVDSLFGIAQNQLLVGGDGSVALKSWERAIERLAALEGAEFQTLKEVARSEFRQLQDFQPMDFGTQVERLFDLADSVAEWPANTIQPGQRPAEPDSDEGWRARLGRVVGSLVRVESVDREFLGPDEVDQAREQMRSTLQTAALAMARSRPDLAHRLIGEAAAAAGRVFDTDATNVSEALSRLEEIASSNERVEPPELTDSRAEISRLLGDMR